MGKAGELIKTHRFVETILMHFDKSLPRFLDVRATLEQTILRYAWLHTEILLPSLRGKPLVEQRFFEGVSQEHQHLDALFKLLMAITPNEIREVKTLVSRIRLLLEAHFLEEAKAIYL